jgi:hypothetical protein
MAGGIGLSVYLIGHYAVVQNFYYGAFNWVTGARCVFGDLLMLIAYCVFFAFMTRACMVLGMLNIMAQRGVPPKMSSTIKSE